MSIVRDLVKQPCRCFVMHQELRLRAVRNRPGGFNVLLEGGGKKVRIYGAANGDMELSDLLDIVNRHPRRPAIRLMGDMT